MDIHTPSPYAQLRTLPVPMQALVEAGLTPTQWIICYILHFQLWEDYLAYTTGPDSPQGFPAEELDDLHERFYLIYEPVPGDHPKTSPKNFRVSERFTDLLTTIGRVHQPSRDALGEPVTTFAASRGTYSHARHGDSEQPPQALELLDKYDELFEAYPSHIPVQGTLVSGRSGDQEQMAALYAKYLTSKKAMSHEDILELVDWAKKQTPSMITMGLLKFITSQEWRGLRDLREGGHDQQTFDSQEGI